MGGSGEVHTDAGRHVRVPLLGYLAPPYRSDYVDLQPTSAGILLVAVALALLWTNMPAAGDSYEHFWHFHLTVGSGDIAITNTFNG